MKTTNEQEQMIFDDYKAWAKTCPDSSLNLWGAYLNGRLGQLRDTKELVDNAKKICEINGELEGKLQEKEQEISNLKLSNKAMTLTMDQYEKEIELLKSKLPDQEKLREAIKELEYLNGTLINASEIMKDEGLLDDEELESESDNIKDSYIKIKTFLEKLK